jgi:hypothetical protein
VSFPVPQLVHVPQRPPALLSQLLHGPPGLLGRCSGFFEIGGQRLGASGRGDESLLNFP